MATVAITPDQDKITAEIFIAAPPERVFPAITDPQQMPKWWGQQGMYRITEWTGDLRPGGKWTSLGVGADGVSFRVEGEYLEVDPPRLLTYTWIASWSGSANHCALGARAPRGSWPTAFWTAKGGHGHDGKTSSRGFRRRSQGSA